MSPVNPRDQGKTAVENRPTSFVFIYYPAYPTSFFKWAEGFGYSALNGIRLFGEAFFSL
jgi:hypothetical protein